MSNSAPTLRERRVAETSTALQTEARHLTSDRGFSGFTIEELCSEVGVSRRTFFNYFASKENAVLGVRVRSDTSDLDEAFVASTGPLLDDLAELFIARWERNGVTKAEAEELGRVFDREPRLLAHFLGVIAEGERDDAALARRRPDAPPDLTAQTAVHVLGALIRPTILEYFGDERTAFPTLLRQRLSVARDLLTSNGPS